MTQQENLRLECLRLASSHLSKEPHNIETLIQWANEFYNFVVDHHKPIATDDPEAPYEVSYIAEKPTGAVSREWLYDKLTDMLDTATICRDSEHQRFNDYYVYIGQCRALQAVIELINPKMQ